MTTFRRLRVTVAPIAVGSMLLACSPSPAPVSQSPRDPASPTAPEGVATAGGSSALAGGAVPAVHGEQAGAASPSHAGHEHGAAPSAGDAGAQAEVYACPMHPEVTSSAAGVCPKCNMKLVKKTK